MKIKQTAGRTQLGEFAPEFAKYNDDVLFGEVWNDETLSPKIRSMFTVTTLVAKGLIDSSFEHHLQFAKSNGVTKSEMAALLTHVAFYAGWPNAWAAFRMAKEVYKDDGKFGGLFGLGEPNTAYAKYFVGNSYLNPLTDPYLWRTLRSSRNAVIIGIYIKPSKAVDKYFYARTETVGIRNGISPHVNFLPATSFIFPQELSIGTVQRKTVGFRILRLNVRA